MGPEEDQAERKRIYHDLIFGVDALGYYISSILFKDPIFFSLELPARNNVFMKRMRSEGISRLIIQTQERTEYLAGFFKTPPKQVYFIQNAPIFEPGQTVLQNNKKKEILYLGNINRGYALESFIEAYSSLPDSYTLCLKGFGINKAYLQELREKYASLFEANRIRIVLDYIQQEDIVRFVSDFYMGIVGYDVELVKRVYDYESSPSGKLFNYYAGGVPVIGLDITGLRSVKEMKAGILLKRITPTSFIGAIRTIEADYESYASNCLDAAVHFDFRDGVKRFLKTVKSNEMQYA